MRMKPDVFLKGLRKYLPKKEMSRVIREMGQGTGPVEVALTKPLPEYGATVDGGSVVGVNFVLDKKLKTYVPVVYVKQNGKVRPVVWTSSR